ncbi:MAG: hypothetical protein Q8R24_00515 [Legionellaceae bacterium]|nr:hypothetical protein [Legionellaceae bacterium]
MRRLVLWGHHIDEYREMFQLSESDLTKHFLEYSSGASAVNFELQHVASECISCDPWFYLDSNTLKTEINTNFEARLHQFKAENQVFDVSRYGSLEKLIAYRREGIATFLADYDQGRIDKRYLPVTDTVLPFSDFAFDFALSTHYLFADLDHQTVDYHIEVIQELARVAKDVRIFPLVDVNGVPSPILGPVLLKLHQANYGVEVRDVAYHLQPKGNAMLRVWAQQCEV